MKAVKKLAIVLSLGVLAASASAETNAQAYVESYAGVTDTPVPVTVISPDITTVRGAEVMLEFVIDEAGMPQGISVAKSNDKALAKAAVKAVAKWRFAPLIKDGESVATKVRLPIVAAIPNFSDARFAAK
ncbi:energy transducer TonB [Opitutaceae bacterium]|nr:energy transducer TonB [Opitutaceae bacterium]